LRELDNQMVNIEIRSHSDELEAEIKAGGVAQGPLVGNGTKPPNARYPSRSVDWGLEEARFSATLKTGGISLSSHIWVKMGL
jgi:hypothetical protein